jgi:hypothetical protein
VLPQLCLQTCLQTCLQEEEAEQLMAPEDYYTEEERLRKEREEEAAAQVCGHCSSTSTMHDTALAGHAGVGHQRASNSSSMCIPDSNNVFSLACVWGHADAVIFVPLPGACVLILRLGLLLSSCRLPCPARRC